jgi:hypothetical protein
MIGALAGLALVGCHHDPLSDLDGTPSAVKISFTELDLNLGASGSITASVVDGRAVPLEIPVSFTSRNTAVATATIDPTYQAIPATSARAVVGTTGLGVTYIVASGGGVSDSVRVVTFPLAFLGALSTTTPKGGQPLAIASTAQLKFSPAAVSVVFPGVATPATIVSATADTVKVLTPYGATPGPLTIAGVAVTYLPGPTITLPTTANVTVSGDYWAADASWQTAPDITALLPASGQSSKILLTTIATDNSAVCPEAALGFGSTGPCMMFHFTGGATYNFSTDWVGAATAPDIDVYACSDSTVANFGTACFEDGGNGATSSKPQATGVHAYPAGDHWFVVEVYGGGSSSNITVTISRP